MKRQEPAPGHAPAPPHAPAVQYSLQSGFPSSRGPEGQEKASQARSQQVGRDENLMHLRDGGLQRAPLVCLSCNELCFRGQVNTVVAPADACGAGAVTRTPHAAPMAHSACLGDLRGRCESRETNQSTRTHVHSVVWGPGREWSPTRELAPDISGVLSARCPKNTSGHTSFDIQATSRLPQAQVHRVHIQKPLQARIAGVSIKQRPRFVVDPETAQKH